MAIELQPQIVSGETPPVQTRKIKSAMVRVLQTQRREHTGNPGEATQNIFRTYTQTMRTSDEFRSHVAAFIANKIGLKEELAIEMYALLSPPVIQFIGTKSNWG
jgi:hypothetical protein